MSEILLVRPRPTLPSPSSPEFSDRVKALLDLREGLTNDQGSRFVTMDQLKEMGLSGYLGGLVTSGPVNTGRGSDATPPNPPTDLNINNLFTAHHITWKNPNDDDLSHIEIWRSETQDVLTSKLVSVATKPIEEVWLPGVMPDKNYYYWIRAIDYSGNYSVWVPNERQGGYLVPADIQGSIQETLQKLSGQITESQLYHDLNSRIDLIDAPSSVAGSVSARIKQEASDRASALLSEATARQTSDQSLQTQINTLVAASSGDFQDLIAALQTESDARIQGDEAEASSRETLATQLRGSYTGSDVSLVTSGLLYSERLARANADSALSTSISSLQATVNQNTASINTEQQARTTADSALASDIAVLNGKVGDNTASIATEKTARISGDNALTSSITTLQNTVNGFSASIQEHAAVINGLSAEYYVKTDVNGYVSGFGLINDGATSSFIITADKFGIVTPGAPAGQTAKIPFMVGKVDGVSTVGINGQLLVDGTIRTHALAADCITADKIGASEVRAEHIHAGDINGNHIAANSSIKLNEGGNLTVGNNNIVLDSVNNNLVIAPDNGLLVGSPNYDGVDYCVLADGDLDFMYWNGSAHVLYNSVKRIESGDNCENNSTVTIPGIWRKPPKIIVSPHSLQTFHKGYVGYNQKINCEAQSITRNSNGVVTFKPVATLTLSDGIIFSNPNKAVSSGEFDPSSDHWYYYNTPTFYTSPDTKKIYLSGYMNLTGLARYCTGRVEIYINDVLLYSNNISMSYHYSSTDIGAGPESWSATINTAQGTHSIRVRFGFVQSWSKNYRLNYYAVVQNMTCYQGSFSQLASGSLSYIAIGE